MRFHRRVWYRALSLLYASIRGSGIILIPWLLLLTAELAHGEKSRSHSLNQSITHLI